MNKYIILFLKGLGIGVANIIPGVSGGTIALITGIFEEIINSIKLFDLTALYLLRKGRLRSFAGHTNLYFLATVFGGAACGIFALVFCPRIAFREISQIYMVIFSRTHSRIRLFCSKKDP